MIHSMLTPFSLLLALGAILGLGWCAVRVPPKESLAVTDRGLLALFGALVGARLGYVAINWGYFQLHTAEIWQVWLGGLSGIGAASGFLATIWVIAMAARQPPGALADQLVPLGISLSASAWLAAWEAGSAYGILSTFLPHGAWLTLPARDEGGTWASRWPTQLVGAVLTLALGAVLSSLRRDGHSRRSLKSGSTAALAILGFGAILFALAYTRVDPTPLWYGLRLDAWAGLSFMGLGLLSLSVISLPFPSQRNPES
jgi:phosphatidylglycerol:prolipoprotein diacylglycerol transferase